MTSSKKTSPIASKLQHAIALHQRGLLWQARSIYEEVLTSEPQNFDATYLLGIVAMQTGNFQAAASLIGKALDIDPLNPGAYSDRGAALKELGRLEAALDSYDRAVQFKPDYAQAYVDRGAVLAELKRYDEALRSYRQAVDIEPDCSGAYFNRGVVFELLNRFEEALRSFDQAIAIKADFVEAHVNRGAVLNALRRWEEALRSFNQAIAIKADFAPAYINRGIALRELRQPEAALDSYNRAIEIDPGIAEAYANRGAVLIELRQLEAALVSYDQALAINPNFAGAHAGRGLVQTELKRFDAALASYDRAIAIDEADAAIFLSRGNLLASMRRFDAAIASFDKAMRLKPDLEFVYGLRLHARMQVSEWGDFEAELAQLLGRIERDELASPPFAVLALSESAPLLGQVARNWVKRECPPNPALGPILKSAGEEKIRIGYFSADFHQHPVSILTAELIELHDRTRFEVIGFSSGPDTQDVMRKRMCGAFDRFIDVRDRSDLEVAQLARSMKVDIAVDLGGFTESSRPKIFALRAAPVQLSYIGYLGTMGAQYMDYLIADPTIIPAADQGHYSEKIVYLPHYQANDSKRCIAQRDFSRKELYLPESGFVFCCFNANYKILPATFSCWMRILQQVSGSVLLLYAGNERVEHNLRKEAARRGIEACRLVFGKKLPYPEHLARYRTADLFLDTWPYNAGATASDALWAGLPVLTLVGRSFAGRIAASALDAIALPELVTSSVAHYEELAVQLATDPRQMAAIREKLAENRHTAPLFDTGRFARHLEAAYVMMYERHQSGLGPDHIRIAGE